MAKPSNWVPTWPISARTISSLLPRRFDSGLITVRFVSNSKRRVALNGIVAGQHPPQLEHLAGADQAGGAQHRFGLHVIGRAPLIACAPLGGTALFIGRRRHDWA